MQQHPRPRAKWGEVREHSGLLFKKSNYSAEVMLSKKSVFPNSIPIVSRSARTGSRALTSGVCRLKPAGHQEMVLGASLGQRGVLGCWGGGRGLQASCPRASPRSGVTRGSSRGRRGFMGQKALRPQPRRQHRQRLGGP